jgi:hypothetical protein
MCVFSFSFYGRVLLQLTSPAHYFFLYWFVMMASCTTGSSKLKPKHISNATRSEFRTENSANPSAVKSAKKDRKLVDIKKTEATKSKDVNEPLKTTTVGSLLLLMQNLKMKLLQQQLLLLRRIMQKKLQQ